MTNPGAKTAAATRTERDLLGDRDVPADAYYGVQTLRAQENFHVTDVPLSHFPRLIEALAQVKRATARANHGLGALDDQRAAAIEQACAEIAGGGASTSTSWWT